MVDWVRLHGFAQCGNRMGMMWPRLRHELSYRWKLFQCRLDTWRNRRHIAQAYRQPLPIEAIRRAVLVACGVVGLVAAVFVSVMVIRAVSPAIGEQFRAVVSAVRRFEAARPEGPRAPADTAAAREPAAAGRDSAASAQPASATLPAAAADTGLPAVPPYLVFVNKSLKTLTVCARGENGWVAQERYPVAIGQSEGRKRSAGDRRTPEGIYFIVGRKERADLAEVFGPLAYVLNYPNRHDRSAGRTGEGIWIHGTAPDSSPVSTRGCLELDNNDIRTLGRRLGAGIGTPVVIVEGRRLGEGEVEVDERGIAEERAEVTRDYAARRREFAGLLDRWRAAWEKKDMAAYASLYDTLAFRSDGERWSRWRERKQRTFDAYSWIKIEIDSLLLADYSETTAVVKFLQGYSSDLARSVAPKRLDFRRGSHGGWVIRREGTISGEESVL